MNMIDKDSVLVQAGASALFTCATGIPAGAGTICTGDTIQTFPQNPLSDTVYTPKWERSARSWFALQVWPILD
jgi:hypothetical protein